MRSFDRGVIYTAIGENYVREAQLSARSVRAFLPATRIVLFTESTPEDKSAFDEVIRLENLNRTPYLDKLTCIKNSPFANTLFLDTDTYLCGSPSELFDLLEKFDIAMALDRRYYDSFPEDAAAPAAFCEFNQGVVAFRQSAQMHKMVQASLDWAEDFYTKYGIPTDDQVSMRVALYSSDLRIATLPQEFNCRFHSFGYLNGKVKILHGRIPGGKHTEANLRRIALKLNKETIPRVFVGGQVYVLARRHFFAIEHTFSRRVATLFRPWPVLCKHLLKHVVRKGERFIERLLRRLRKA
jgi:hypothetical protein